MVMAQLADMHIDPQETWKGVSTLDAFLLGMVNLANGSARVDREELFEVISLLCKTPEVGLRSLLNNERHMYFERYPGGNALLRCLVDGVAPEIAIKMAMAVWACSLGQHIEEWVEHLQNEFGNTKIQGVHSLAWLVSQSIDDDRSKAGFGHMSGAGDIIKKISTCTTLIRAGSNQFSPLEKLLCASSLLWNWSAWNQIGGSANNYPDERRDGAKQIEQLLEGVDVGHTLANINDITQAPVSPDVLLSLGISLLHSLAVIAPEPPRAWEMVSRIAPLLYLRGHDFVHRSAFTALLSDIRAPTPDFWEQLPVDITGNHMALSILAGSYDNRRYSPEQQTRVAKARLDFVSDMRKWATRRPVDLIVEQAMTERITKVRLMGYKAWKEDPSLCHEMECHLMDLSTAQVSEQPVPKVARL